MIPQGQKHGFASQNLRGTLCKQKGAPNEITILKTNTPCQCPFDDGYLMPDETALRELSEGVIKKLKLLTDAEFAELEFPPD